MASRDNVLLGLTPEVLLKAYACGIFPMAESAEDPALFWIEPEQRGIIPRDASKIALVHLVARLKLGGFELLDAQFLTDHLKMFGATEVPQERYGKLLAKAIRGEADISAFKRELTGAEAVTLVTE